MQEHFHRAPKQTVRFIGLGLKHPLGYALRNATAPTTCCATSTRPMNGAVSSTSPTRCPSTMVTSTVSAPPAPSASRAFCLSLFPEEGGHMLYFSGFDDAALVELTYHNTA